MYFGGRWTKLFDDLNCLSSDTVGFILSPVIISLQAGIDFDRRKDVDSGVSSSQ